MTDSAGAAFGLVDDAWLPCLMTDGTRAELSLRQVLLSAHLVRELSLDVPTQFPPVLRVLLAVSHRALRKAGTSGGPRSEEAWRHLWQLGSLPGEPLNGYLDKWRDRFQLFHPATPFFQVAGLRTAGGEAATAALLIPFASSGNNAPLFSAARDGEPPSLTCAEAARWLLHVHAWDTAGIKTGALGDSRVTGGKTYGNLTGPLGQLGVLIPIGPTLWHTLLLNLLVLDDDISPPGDHPAWEAPPLAASWHTRQPRGLLDLYTWAARRVRLFAEHSADGVRVRRAVISAGDRIEDITLLAHLEPHTAWQRSKAQEAKLKRERVYLPRRHQPGRQLWRGLGAILAQAQADRPGDGIAPRALESFATRGGLLRGVRVRLLGVGIAYGNQAAVIDDTYADALPVPVALLADRGGDWESAVLEAVRIADDAASAVAGLAANLARAVGCQDDRLVAGQRDRARERLYAELDGRFRMWLAGLAEPDRAPDREIAGWAGQVRKHANAIAAELLEAAAPEGWRGREVRRGGERGALLTVPLAEIWYRAALRRAVALPIASGEPAAEEEARA